MRTIRILLQEIIQGRVLLLNLAKNDLKSRYAGSFFGIVWALIQPLVTILVFWYVFQVGFKTAPVNNVEFILWFAAAYIPWVYFNDGLMSTTNCLYEYNYLIKKIKFPVSLLPLVKVCSSAMIHSFFICFIFFMYLVYGYAFNVMWFQALYYTFALTCLLVGLSWIMSSLAVFFKDFSQIVAVVLQVGFWLTPIFWSPEGMSEAVLFTIKLNPLYYITQGYRDTFIYSVSFMEHPTLTAYFWIVTGIVFIVGAVLYQKLRPHFADIL